MKILIKLLRGVLTAALCVLLLFNVWMLVQQNILKKDAPEVFGVSQYIVTSGSMEPSFSPGDMILVKKQDSYKLGDVVTFLDGQGQTVTHRIVGAVSGQFITKGDANNTEDADLLPPERISGRLWTVLPGVGSAAMFLRSPMGILVLLAVGVLLIMLPDWAGALKTKAEGKHAQ